ncbi:MAG: redoxin domain-containing protein [Acidobacteria bacterium]|jgi:thiol-disulfide isomerase/thioredoxin|nr:redoxin domain-containing protein [Acidobacteriota bacterium]MBA3806094.1 redoxin domain-containing protein [Acidobacteriota bacterium]
MKNRITRPATLVVMLVALLASLALSVTAQDMMGNTHQMSKKGQPMVAIIRADWCSACQKLEPAMAELMEQYKDRINFVVLDVTTDEKTAASSATARKLGISNFFKANKKKTSTVAIFGAKKKLLFRTDHNADRDAFVRAFDDAIAKNGQRG